MLSKVPNSSALGTWRTGVSPHRLRLPAKHCTSGYSGNHSNTAGLEFLAELPTSAPHGPYVATEAFSNLCESACESDPFPPPLS